MTKRAWPAPNYPTRQMDTPDILNDNRTDGIGELAPTDTVRNVHVNMNWARTEEGARCIHITGPPNFTVAEIEALLPILADVVQPIRDLRATKGFPD